MGVRYYLSGCAHKNTFANTLGDCLIKDITKTDNIVFIAGEPKNRKYTEASAAWFLQEIADRDVYFINCNVIHNYTPHYLAQHWIKKADMIILLGGNPLLQKKMCKKLHILGLLKEYDGIMMGMSAGAMLMSKHIIINPISVEYPEFIVKNGLNRDNLSIYPHNNTLEDEYPDELDVGMELYHKADLLIAAYNVGEYYLLQDYHESESNGKICRHSFIRATDTDVKLYSENQGKTWLATKDGIKLIEDI